MMQYRMFTHHAELVTTWTKLLKTRVRSNWLTVPPNPDEDKNPVRHHSPYCEPEWSPELVSAEVEESNEWWEVVFVPLDAVAGLNFHRSECASYPSKEFVLLVSKSLFRKKIHL